VSVRWHKQTLMGGGGAPLHKRGDCVRACLTAVLGLPIDAIENVHGDGWWERLCREVRRHGYDLAVLNMEYEPPAEAYWIATVPSLNLPPEPDGSRPSHCVVARGYSLIHDPTLGTPYDIDSWTAAWNAGQVEGWALVPVDAAAVAA
jgi:hypothetical protein